MHGRHVRNVHAFPRTHRRTHSRSLYLYIRMYVRTRVSRAMATLLRVHDHRSVVKPYAPVNVSLYVRYFGFVRRDTRENDGFG